MIAELPQFLHFLHNSQKFRTENSQMNTTNSICSRKDDYNYGFTNEDQYSSNNGGQRLQNNSYLLTAPSNNEDSGSPYSPSGASHTDNSYNSLPRNMATGSILKNGSLRSRNRAYGGKSSKDLLG